MASNRFKDLYRATFNHFEHKYKLTNVYVFDWESDYFGVSKTGYAYEIELKVTKSDFKADFKKERKHRLLAEAARGALVLKGSEVYQPLHIDKIKELYPHLHPDELKKDWKENHFRIPISTSVQISPPFTPHRFFYACPEGVVDIDEVPDYAGLMVMNEGEFCMRVVKSAPLLHKRELKINGTLLDKFYYTSVQLRAENMQLKQAMLDIQRRYEVITAEEYKERQLELLL